MKYIALFMLSSGAVYASVYASDGPVCHQCEVIREYNKQHPGDFQYYEDYLEAQKKAIPHRGLSPTNGAQPSKK